MFTITGQSRLAVKSRLTAAFGAVLYVFATICLNVPISTATAETITHTYRWTKTVASSGSAFNQVVQVEADSEGNVYSLGAFKGTVTFDGPGGTDTVTNSSSSHATLYLTKYNSDGDYQWTKTMGLSGNGEITPMGLAIDSSDNIYFTASFNDVITFNDFASGGLSATLPSGVTDSFVMKLNADGTHAWHKHIAATADSYAPTAGLAVDDAGNVDVVGYYNGEVQFDEDDVSTDISNPTADTMFVAQFDNDGNFNWMTEVQAGTTNSFVQPYAVAVKSNGTVVVAGYYMGNGTGDIGIDTDGFANDFITYIGSNGVYEDTTYFDNTDGQAGNYGVAVDWADNVYVTGSY